MEIARATDAAVHLNRKEHIARRVGPPEKVALAHKPVLVPDSGDGDGIIAEPAKQRVGVKVRIFSRRRQPPRNKSVTAGPESPHETQVFDEGLAETVAVYWPRPQPLPQRAPQLSPSK